MRAIVQTPIAILALNAGDKEYERGILKANGFHATKSLDGVYKGHAEQAWLVCISDSSRQGIIALAKAYNQESVLFSGIDRTCTLHYVEDGREVIAGVLTEVPENFAKDQPAYTYDKVANQYWVAL